MKDINTYLGGKTELQISLIRGILSLINEGQKKFSSEMVARKANINPKLVGGAWTALTKETKYFPALLVMRGKKIERDINGNIIQNAQYWGINDDIDWAEIEDKISNYL